MVVNGGILFVCVVLLMAIEVPRAAAQMGQIPERKNIFKKKRTHSRPIDTVFKLPTATTSWPKGNGFARGVLDLGGLQVSAVSTFNKIWGAIDGGPDDKGASVFEPIGIPQGFSMLGSYSQPNNKPLFGYVLVAKDVSSSTTKSTLKPPIDYTFVLKAKSYSATQVLPLYIWLPVAPNGYRALGHVVTKTRDKPPLDKIMCVRSDLTEKCETSSLIWGSEDFNFYDVRPISRGTQLRGIHVGTFVAQNGRLTNPPSISCLKNLNSISKIMPNLQQIKPILKVYSPFLYLHPDEKYLPSSVNWFFSNGALLYKKGDESNPRPIAQNGTNLPQGPNPKHDRAYWIDLPADHANKDRVKQGNLQSAESYVHVKPMFGGTFTDFAMWTFYPFNGPGRLKIGFINIKLERIGEHVGDWEHVTLRVSNLDGKLWKVYFSHHKTGSWVDSSQLEFQNDTSNIDFPTKRPVVHASLHGHSTYPHAGLVLLGKKGIGARDDTDKSSKVMDMGKYVLVSAEYLGSKVKEPAWLNFYRTWGPHVDYKLEDELNKLKKLFLGKLKHVFEKVIRGLPKEMLQEEGPTGPKEKKNWNGDEL